MKKFFTVGFICMTVLSTVSSAKAFEWSSFSPFYLCWYDRQDSTMCRNLTSIKNSIVTYGNSKKPWSTSEATQIQDKWFELNKTSLSKSTNVIVQYTFSSAGDPNFLQAPWLAGGTPPITHD